MQQEVVQKTAVGSWGPVGQSAQDGREPALKQIARFVSEANYARVDVETRLALKRTVLDTAACAISALGGEPATKLREQFSEYGGNPLCTMIGGGKTSPDQATLLNSVLVRYVDVLDTYMSPGGLCHPSDNFGAVLAAAEMADRSGQDFLLALGIAYEVQCRFTEVVPVMFRGLNHALQLSISVAAAASRLLDLTPIQAANAMAIAAADNVSLAVVHVEPVSNWKGVSPGWSGMRALYGTSLAKKGFTGPIGLFEGPNGLNRLFDQDIVVDWINPSLHASRKTVFKKYAALVHGQPVLETVLSLRAEHGIQADEVSEVLAEVFQFAYEISGGGHFGNKDKPQSKEQADYNLKYLISAALIDGEVGPAQLETERVRRDDVQRLLQRVSIKPQDEFTRLYPQQLACRITIKLRDGREFVREQTDFEGSVTRPFSWERVVEKFHWLSEPFADDQLRNEIVSAVEHLDEIKTSELTNLLGRVSPTAFQPRTRKPL
ncbi:2-methylcitrate dehydratase [Bradyrhizobium sp. USDA 4461]